jgi:hypothetical protein
MKITITPKSEDGKSLPPLTLGDDEKREVVNGLLPKQSREVRSVAYVRGDYMEFFPSGNKQNSGQFTVERTHKDYDAAVDFVVMHAEKVPAQGLITVRHKRTVRYYEDACITSVTCLEHKGVTTIFSYEFVCGQAKVNTI